MREVELATTRHLFGLLLKPLFWHNNHFLLLISVRVSIIHNDPTEMNTMETRSVRHPSTWRIGLIATCIMYQYGTGEVVFMVGEAGPLWHVHMLGYSQVRPFVLTAARPKHNKKYFTLFVLADPDLEPKGSEFT
jgi:hypothetical protein